MDDDSWSKAARRGDGRAFEEIVRAHQRAVYGMAMRLLRDHDEADDVAQRTFLRAWDALGDFEARSSLRTWLLKICMNLARNRIRDRSRLVREVVEIGEDAPGSARLEEAESAALVREAIAELPEKQRLAVELRVYQGLPFKDVAVALETTENSAKVSFHYAVKALKAKLGGLMKIAEGA